MQIQCGGGGMGFGGCDGEGGFDFVAELAAELILGEAGAEELLRGLAPLLEGGAVGGEEGVDGSFRGAGVAVEMCRPKLWRSSRSEMWEGLGPRNRTGLATAMAP